MSTPSPLVVPKALPISHKWWGLLLRGLAAILFGILTIAAPGPALVAFVFFFGIFAIVEGAVNVISEARGGGKPGFAVVTQGVVSISAGVVALAWPRITTLALVLIVAIWAVVTGILEIIAAFKLRKVIR